MPSKTPTHSPPNAIGRPAWRAWYSQAYWINSTRAFRELHPLCAECQRNGRVSVTECVDHVVPHRGEWELFADQSNWQGLCWKCHASKTRRGE